MSNVLIVLWLVVTIFFWVVVINMVKSQINHSPAKYTKKSILSLLAAGTILLTGVGITDDSADTTSNISSSASKSKSSGASPESKRAFMAASASKANSAKTESKRIASSKSHSASVASSRSEASAQEQSERIASSLAQSSSIAQSESIASSRAFAASQSAASSSVAAVKSSVAASVSRQQVYQASVDAAANKTVYVTGGGTSDVYWYGTASMPANTNMSNVVTMTESEAINLGKRHSLRE